jgi:DNA-binding MarR family transcriptional regulator
MFNKFQLGTQPAEFLAKAKLDSVPALVLLKLMCHINKFNMVVGTPKEISKMSGMTIGDFTVGIRALKKYDLVRKYTKKEYMLNPDIMINGDDKQYYVVKHMWDTQTSTGLRT